MANNFTAIRINRWHESAPMASVLAILLLLAAWLPPATVAQIATPSTSSSIAITELPAAHYTVVAQFQPESRLISGSLRLDWRNHTGEVQTSLPFRLYPNDASYHEGGTVVTSAVVDSQRAETYLADDPTVLNVELPETLAPGQQVQIAFDFATTIPTTTEMDANVLLGDDESGWWMADWLPILAGWEPSAGWYLASPDLLGNPTFADSSIWHLTLTLPADLMVVGGGAPVVTHPLPDSTRHQIEITTPPARDLTLVLIPASVSPIVTERQVGNLTVRTVLPAERSRPELTALLLETAAEILPLYETWLGQLPASELNVVNVASDSFHGVAWNGIVWLNLDAVAPFSLDEQSSNYLRFIVAHELAHLWFNHTVGSNNNTHGFLSESLASHLALLALAEIDPETAAEVLADEVVAPYLRLLEGGNDGVVDLDSQRIGEMANSYALLYGKGTLGFEAIRQIIGHDAYLQSLKSYASTFWFAVSTPEDLLAAFDQASGEAAAVWQKWFREATTTTSDVDAVVRGFAPTPVAIIRRAA